MDTSKIKADLMVHAKGEDSMQGAPGEHIGTVDHMDGENYIKLNKKDSADGQHHWIPVAWVESINEKAVYLNKISSEVMAGLINEKPAS